MYREHDLSYDFLGIHVDNPFILSAAPPTDELDMAIDGLKAGWAGVVLKTTSVESNPVNLKYPMMSSFGTCLLYTSDAADDLLCVDLGGRRIIKKKKKNTKIIKS